MPEAAMTGKGQGTIPADIRKALGLVAGERVVFTQLDDGSTIIRAQTRSMADLKGLMKSPASNSNVPLDVMRTGRRCRRDGIPITWGSGWSTAKPRHRGGSREGTVARCARPTPFI